MTSTDSTVSMAMTPSLKMAICAKFDGMDSFGFSGLIAKYGNGAIRKVLIGFLSNHDKREKFEADQKKLPNTANNFKVYVLYPLFGKQLFDHAQSFPCCKSCTCYQDETAKEYPHANSSTSCLGCTIMRAKMIEALV